MKFSYSARNEEGGLERGEIDLPSERELADYLRNKGLVLTHAEAVQANQTSSKKMTFKIPWLGGRVSSADKIFFAQNLQVMIKAGLSVAIALKTQAAQTSSKAFKEVLEDVYQKVDRGIPLSDALGGYPKVFSELFVNMVRAGEKSGKLEEVLQQVTTQLRKSHALISKVRGALTYPVIVVVAMICIAIAMMVFVIPKITAVFQEVNATLPLPTRLLIATSDFMIHNSLWLLAGTIIFAVLFVRFIHTPYGRHLWHALLLKLPIFSPILRKINLAKFARTFSSLLKTDIPIVQAFQITATTLGNVLYRQAIEDAAERVKKGVAISSIIRDYPKLFSPLIIQMTTVGEETGTLDSILDELAQFYEEDVDRTMSNLSTIIEPILMLLLGVGVGGLAVAIILPIYSLTQNV
ncbi:MAG: type II secretion system F family protein [Candidatus Kerfeldbacteria bacterium]|nr:type II secretion system F family protein [Candidatus Kerfeldbacteria bacterium]